MSRSAPLGVRPADLLPELHRRLLEATNGVRSVLLRQSSKGDYKAVSGRGFAELGDVWLTGDEAAGLDSLTVGGRAPELAARGAAVARRPPRGSLRAPHAGAAGADPHRARGRRRGEQPTPSPIGRQRSRPDLRPRWKWRRSNGRFACTAGCASSCCSSPAASRRHSISPPRSKPSRSRSRRWWARPPRPSGCTIVARASSS